MPTKAEIKQRIAKLERDIAARERRRTAPAPSFWALVAAHLVDNPEAQERLFTALANVVESKRTAAAVLQAELERRFAALGSEEHHERA